MNDKDLFIGKFLSLLSDNNFDKEIITDIFDSSVEYSIDLLDHLSLIIAIKYFNREIEFKLGDYIMNIIFFKIFDILSLNKSTNPFSVSQNELPRISRECYLAFDAGEYYRDNDDKNVDPSEKYTRPLIEELLRDLNKI